ncbi:MAG: ABC transporter ATP-binding protein, partial [Firmicutes bacterium]|nr:ABC transporter ATP-binding protein [Bacillota bacterium]
ANPPSGCAFHPRCRYAVAQCEQTRPELKEYEQGHFCACHFAEEFLKEKVRETV